MIQIDNYYYLVLVIAISCIIAFFYYKSQNFISDKTKFLLISLRALTLIFLCFILLSPVVKCRHSKLIKPKVVFLIDNSKSIKLAHNININELMKKIERFANNIKNSEVDILFKAFDSDWIAIDSLSSMGTETNLVKSIESTIESFANENVSNIVLVTDGNFNSGNHPSMLNNKSQTKISCILIGDTISVSDAKIENLDYNSLMMSNEKNNLYINFSCVKPKNAVLKIRLEKFEEGRFKIVSSKLVKTSSDFFTGNLYFDISETKKGKYNYRVMIEPISSEKNLFNNSKSFQIEVIDGIKNVEIVALAPHPDISAIKTSLESNKSFNVKLNINPYNVSFDSKSDLYILYQIPSVSNASFKFINEKNFLNKSVLYVLGTQSDYIEFNKVQSNYNIQFKSNIVQDYIPVGNKNFSEFFLESNTFLMISKFPPLTNNLVSVEPKTDLSIPILYRLGNIQSTQPLFSFFKSNKKTVGLILGENLWKWKMIDFKVNNSTEHFDEIIVKMVNALTIKKENSQLEIICKESIIENESFNLKAITYNDLFQPVQASLIQCEIKSEKFKKNFELHYQDKDYLLNLKLDPAEYQYRVKAIINNKEFINLGNFIVMKNEKENEYLPANFSDMKDLCTVNHGHVILLSNLKDSFNLLFKINGNNPKLVEFNQTNKLNDFFIILVLLVLVLSIEYVIRKYYNLH